MVKVKINQGTLIGTKKQTKTGFEFNAFLEIPYAQPPIGELRFKRPQPPVPWNGERDATSVNLDKMSFQLLIKWIPQTVPPMPGMEDGIGSEDCLYLNVYTPSTQAKDLPVMVYIHGGGYAVGSGTVNFIGGDPDYFVEHNVVVVNINYRLGPFGFLSLDIPEAAGNMGLKDQLLALQWVHENISHFGGNKNNVTIIGVSAGAASCEFLLMNPTSDGLFHKAILHSGTTLNHWSLNYNIYDKSLALARELGYQGPGDDPHAIYKHVIKIPTKEIGKAMYELSKKDTSKQLDFEFVPSIEKYFGDSNAFITEHPFKLLQEGRFRKIPVIRGNCNAEGLLMFALKINEFTEVATEKTFTDFFTFQMTKEDKHKFNMKFLEMYVDKATDNEDNFAVNFFTDYDFASAVLISALLTSQKDQPTYFYEFCHDGNRNIFKQFYGVEKKGACHADDVGYIFPGDFKNEDDIDTDVSRKLVQMWTDFAKTNDPTPSISDLIPIKWPQFDITDRQYLQICKDLCVKTKHNLERVAIFQDILENYHESVKDYIEKKREGRNDPTPSISDLIPIKWPQFDITDRQYLQICKDLCVKTKHNLERVAIFQDIIEKYHESVKDCIDKKREGRKFVCI